jgi:8-oxo-dGTP diphosphatase
MNIPRKQIIVSSALIEKEGKFLIIQRATHDTRPGTWETPGGGLEWGEDPEVAVKREVKEECGLNITVIEPVKILSWTNKREGVQTHKIQLVYRCALSHPGQEVVLSPDHSAYKWVDESQLTGEKVSFFLESLYPNTTS